MLAHCALSQHKNNVLAQNKANNNKLELYFRRVFFPDKNLMYLLQKRHQVFIFISRTYPSSSRVATSRIGTTKHPRLGRFELMYIKLTHPNSPSIIRGFLIYLLLKERRKISLFRKVISPPFFIFL